MAYGKPQTGLHAVEVLTNEQVASGVCRAVLLAPTLAGKISAGQFVNVDVPGDPSYLLRTPLAISDANPAQETIELVYATVGAATRRLAALPRGAQTTVVGPCGQGWRIADAGRILLVAGGIGITPILALARTLHASRRSFDAVIGAQRAAQLWGVRELKAAEVVDLCITTDDGSAGMAGFTTEGVKALMAQHTYDCIYTCGPTSMMAQVASMAADAHVSCQASLERMMTCAFGACGTCNVAMVAGGYKSCCTDGPVFDACEVAW